MGLLSKSFFALMLCSLFAVDGFTQTGSGVPAIPQNIPHDIQFQNQATPYSDGSIRPATAQEKEIWISTLQTIFFAARGGSQKISWVDFSELFEKMSRVQLFINTSSLAIVGSGSRTGSVYFTKENSLVLNMSVLQRLADPGVGIMAVHEFCGAIGLPDENFEISSYLYLKIHPETVGPKMGEIEESLSRFLDKNPRRIQDLHIGGGGSGVGGGGDPDIGEIKSMLLREFAGLDGIPAEYRPKIIDALITVDLEPMSVPGSFKNIYPSGYLGLNYAIFDNKIVIAIDTQIWEIVNGNGDKAQIVMRSQFLANLLQLVLLLNHLPGNVSLPPIQ